MADPVNAVRVLAGYFDFLVDADRAVAELLAYGDGDDIVIRASDGTVWRQPESVTDAHAVDPVVPE